MPYLLRVKLINEEVLIVTASGMYMYHPTSHNKRETPRSSQRPFGMWPRRTWYKFNRRFGTICSL